MTEPYFTENHKMYKFKERPRWTHKEQTRIQETLIGKGYLVNMVSRVGCDRKWHDAWQVYRADVPQLVEELFRQRLVVEVQAEGKGMASINFVYDYFGDTVVDAVGRFRKNKRNGGKLF